MHLEESTMHFFKFFATLVFMTLNTSFCFPAVVAFYRFENGSNGQQAIDGKSILDSSGNGLHGSPSSPYNPTYSSNVPLGQSSSNLSMRFVPSVIGQGVRIDDNPLFHLTKSLTLEAYIYSENNPGADAGQIIFRGDDLSGKDPYALFLETNGKLRFQIQNENDQGAALSTDVPLALKRWYHVAGTLDDTTGTMSLYVDGILKKSLVTAYRPYALLNSSANPGLGIGTIQSFSQRFDGFIDEVRISDMALSPSGFLMNQSVPEPISIASWGGFGLVGLFLRKRRRYCYGSQVNPEAFK